MIHQCIIYGKCTKLEALHLLHPEYALVLVLLGGALLPLALYKLFHNIADKAR